LKETGLKGVKILHIDQATERQDVWKKFAIGQTQTWIWWSKESNLAPKSKLLPKCLVWLSHHYKITCMELHNLEKKAS
jgi:hypothetical protein